MWKAPVLVMPPGSAPGAPHLGPSPLAAPGAQASPIASWPSEDGTEVAFPPSVPQFIPPALGPLGQGPMFVRPPIRGNMGAGPSPGGFIIKNSTVFVGNLPQEAAESEITDLMSRVGGVQSCRLVRDLQTQQHKGYAYVDYHDPGAAEAAQLVLDGVEFHGRPIRIQRADQTPQGAVPMHHGHGVRPAGPLPPGGVPPAFLDQLRTQVEQVSGTSGKLCRHGVACKHVACRDEHPEGREMERDLSMIVCRFRRNCKRTGCFYVHPSGREIDEDPSKGMCKRGELCDLPECIFAHPETRVGVHQVAAANYPCRVRCFNCGTFGHTQWACSRKVRLSGFPVTWALDTAEELSVRLSVELEAFGTLATMPEVSEENFDSRTATAVYHEPASARSAVLALTGDPFTAEIMEGNSKASSAGGAPAPKRERACTVFVGNIPYDADEGELRELLSSVGDVEEFRLVRDRGTKEHKGYGFCDYPDPETAKAAVEVLHEALYQGRKLRVTASDRALGDPSEAPVKAIVTGFPEQWLLLEQEDLVRQVSADLEIYGPLAAPPELMEGNTKALVEFANEKIAIQTQQALLTVLTIELRPLMPGVAKNRGGERHGPRRDKGDKSCTVFVGNISFDTEEEDLRSVFMPFGNVISVRLVCDKDTKKRKGYGFVEFADPASAQRAEKEMDEVEVKGRRLRVSPAEAALGEARRGDEGRDGDGRASRSPGRPAKRRRRKGEENGDEEGRERWRVVGIHIDELAMSRRPEVPPCSEDREVWVDPLPDKQDEEEWLGAFGKVDDVFRIEDMETGEVVDRGYVVFADHEAAARCVEAKAAEWSESERVLTSQSSHRGGRRSAYPDSLVALMVGPKGETINAVKDRIGASMLALRGDGLGGTSPAQKSSRLHFVCKGNDEVISNLRPALEDLLAEIHRQVSDKIANLPANGAARSTSENQDQQKNKKRRRRSRSPQRQVGRGHDMQFPPMPPPMAWPAPGPGPWHGGWGGPVPGWLPPGWEHPGWEPPPPGWEPHRPGWGHMAPGLARPSIAPSRAAHLPRRSGVRPSSMAAAAGAEAPLLARPAAARPSKRRGAEEVFVPRHSKNEEDPAEEDESEP